MLFHTLPIGFLLLLQPPAFGEPDAAQSDPPHEGLAAGFVEDMPDPYGPEWEPPEGPKRPPPAPPPPSLAPQTEFPPDNTMAPNLSIAAVHGQRLQLAGIVIGVGGVIGLAVAAYLYDDLNKTRNELSVEQSLVDTGAGSSQRVEELQNKLQQQRQGMIIALVPGASSLGLGALLFGVGTAMKNRPPSTRTTWLSPGPGLVGVAVGGRF
jgi:hypothetical protein